MDVQNLPISDEAKPIAACLDDPEQAALAIIIGVDGPSYRPLGAIMALLGQDHWVGTLSSGCVESDISLHGLEARENNAPKTIKYGKGSPYLDIQLPCGGGLEILILPRPDVKILGALLEKIKQRIPCTLDIDIKSGELSVKNDGITERNGGRFSVRFEPAPLFLVFGKGPEASTFSALVNAAGYPNIMFSPDNETLNLAKVAGCKTQYIAKAHFPPDLAVDHRTAVVLFFHDHDWEPDILLGALETDAFYIGAQGSKSASVGRMMEMTDKGASQTQLDRLAGPIGLIPSVRDAKTLAVSVLAEILLKCKS